MCTAKFSVHLYEVACNLHTYVYVRTMHMCAHICIDSSMGECRLHSGQVCCWYVGELSWKHKKSARYMYDV